MSLRRKSLLNTLVTMTALLGILYAVSQSILLGSFLRLEAQSITNNVERVINTLADEIAALSSTAVDWAYWDDTYNFVQGSDDGYVSSNLADSTLANLNLNFIFFVDASRSLVYGKEINLESGEEVPLDENLVQQLMAHDNLFQLFEPEDERSGYIDTAQGPAIIAARPILTSLEEGPPAGTLIMGRYLNFDKMHTLSQSLRVDLELHPVNATDHEGFQDETPDMDGIHLHPLSETMLNAYTTLEDISAQPALYLHVILPREIYAQGQSTLQYVLLAFLGIGLVVAFSSLLHTNRLLLRLSRLSDTVTRIRETGDTSVHLSVEGKDEIANLTRGLYEMLAALARSRNELQQAHDHLEVLVAQRTADLAQARDQALEALRLKSQILANISHDARTPLSVILLRARMLQAGRYGPLSDIQIDKLDSIIFNVNQLTNFINNLLDGAQMENARLRLHMADVSPLALLVSLDEMQGPLARSEGLQLNWAVADDVPETIYTDANRVKQMLSNLVDNAIKFTKTGSITARITCPDAEHWALEVADTGPGIPPDALSRIFDAFWQVDGSLTRQANRGVGLGLSIVKQLVELMKGEISVESEVGKGSTFRLIFPLNSSKEQITDAQVVGAGR